ncbi:MAG TPA: ribosome silencing factor [Candidatus Eisenbacteria bacterium]
MTRRQRLARSAAEPARHIPAGVPALDLLHAAAHAAVSKKARTPVALDLRELDGVCDYFFICSGSSEVQVKAIAEAVEDALRDRGARPWHIEGFESRRWVLLDYVEVVVHVFHEKTREYYMLDRLWGDARSLDLGLERAD